MNNEIEYIEPTQEHVGQMVEVRPIGDDKWQRAKLVGIAHDEYRFTAKRSHDNYGICWKYARIPRPLTYAERQARCGLKVGDRVKITSLPETEQDGWEDSVSYGMSRLVGSVHHIRSDNGPYGFHVGEWNWPYFVLEKVEDRAATFNDIGKQVYVEGTPGDVFTFEMVYGIEGDVWRAVVRSGDKRFVYELSNLRVKE